MLDWLKNINKEYPEFWKSYSSKFDKKSSRYVILSTETTGLNPEKDVILSLGAFAVKDNAVHIGDNFESYLTQYKFLHDNGLTNEFMMESTIKKSSEPQAIQSFIEYIENAILVGHHIDFDVAIINEALERMGCGRLKNEALDVDVMHRKLNDISDKETSLDTLCELYHVPISDRNSAADDAYKTALLFLKLKSKLKIK
ncbi:3'-5' exonuclease [Flavobacterium sp. F-328]|jgi:DNA polymerase-3 subunit epsilon|uniref:3'-5' exonuclease n=1 Tax=Flavobacterium erciyesense TaxID=2825842 RepID=A0ABS5D429_9FLAO|nr:3'-5' exonuclease [Flavobacterium erciyesense]MBQ0908783.1 3'-5' exonuclease [Flavobacterium erciyesense]